MPLYQVPMFGSSSATATVVVEAPDATAAADVAFRSVRDGDIDVDWDYDHVDALHAGDAELASIDDMLKRESTAEREEPNLRRLVSECPLGYVDGRLIAARGTTDDDVVAWIQRLVAFADGESR